MLVGIAKTILCPHIFPDTTSRPKNVPVNASTVELWHNQRMRLQLIVTTEPWSVPSPLWRLPRNFPDSSATHAKLPRRNRCSIQRPTHRWRSNAKRTRICWFQIEFVSIHVSRIQLERPQQQTSRHQHPTCYCRRNASWCSNEKWYWTGRNSVCDVSLQL